MDSEMISGIKKLPFIPPCSPPPMDAISSQVDYEDGLGGVDNNEDLYDITGLSQKLDICKENSITSSTNTGEDIKVIIDAQESSSNYSCALQSQISFPSLDNMTKPKMEEFESHFSTMTPPPLNCIVSNAEEESTVYPKLDNVITISSSESVDPDLPGEIRDDIGEVRDDIDSKVATSKNKFKSKKETESELISSSYDEFEVRKSTKTYVKDPEGWDYDMILRHGSDNIESHNIESHNEVESAKYVDTEFESDTNFNVTGYKVDQLSLKTKEIYSPICSETFEISSSEDKLSKNTKYLISTSKLDEGKLLVQSICDNDCISEVAKSIVDKEDFGDFCSNNDYVAETKLKDDLSCSAPCNDFKRDSTLPNITTVETTPQDIEEEEFCNNNSNTVVHFPHGNINVEMSAIDFNSSKPVSHSSFSENDTKNDLDEYELLSSFDHQNMHPLDQCDPFKGNDKFQSESEDDDFGDFNFIESTRGLKLEFSDEEDNEEMKLDVEFFPDTNTKTNLQSSLGDNISSDDKFSSLVLRWLSPCPHPSRLLSKTSCSTLNDIIEEDAFIWHHLEDIDSSLALKLSWPDSQTNKLYLASLNVDARNILFGHKWSSTIPLFAQTLSFSPLTPAKPSSSSQPPWSFEGKASPTELNITSLPSKIDMPVISNQNVSKDPELRIIPPAQFDWSSSGLTNPLDTSGLEKEIESESAKDAKSPFESAVIEPAVVPSPLLERILKDGGGSSPAANTLLSSLPPEVKDVVKSLPDLNFMRSKVLMFPILHGS